MKWCLYVRKDLAEMGDGFFESPDLHGMRSDTYMYKYMKEMLASEDIQLHTQHRHKPEDSDVVIFLNETTPILNYQRTPINKKIVLILTEPPVYNAIDWTEERHENFDLVFSYDKDLLKRQSGKYRFVHFPIQFSKSITVTIPEKPEFERKRFACLVAGAFAITKGPSKHKSLLYERYKILKWYNHHAPNFLDFFSRTDPKPKFSHFRGAEILSRINKNLPSSIGNILFNRNLSFVYHGSIPPLEKNKFLSNYRYNYCLENSYGIKGLISEKIFDCFEAGTIPIYHGAPDISEYIPNGCYISYSDFSSVSEVHQFLKNMDYKTYISYLNAAANFLWNGADSFSVQNFVQSITDTILK